MKMFEKNGPECETMYRFRYVFLLNIWFDITTFASKAPKVQEVVEIAGSGPLHSFANIIYNTYIKFQNKLACIRVVMDQNVKQYTDFAMYFY